MSRKDPVNIWHDLAALHTAIEHALEHELRKEHDLSRVEYEVLSKMTQCEHGKARIQEIADLTQLNQSTASRVVARLEDEGLATRAICDDDRRGIFAAITPAGRDRAAAAEPTYRAVLEAQLPA